MNNYEHDCNGNDRDALSDCELAEERKNTRRNILNKEPSAVTLQLNDSIR